MWSVLNFRLQIGRDQYSLCTNGSLVKWLLVFFFSKPRSSIESIACYFWIDWMSNSLPRTQTLNNKKNHSMNLSVALFSVKSYRHTHTAYENIYFVIICVSVVADSNIVFKGWICLFTWSRQLCVHCALDIVCDELQAKIILDRSLVKDVHQMICNKYSHAFAHTPTK